MPDALPEGGTVRPIVRWSDPVLHHKLEPVTQFDDDLRTLVADLTATMRAADGVGLAACQVGRQLAVFVFDCPDAGGAYQSGVVCNPELYLPVGKHRRLDESEEGCLSLPGAFTSCARPDYARVDGQDADGRPVSYAGDGLLARCLQHETDHCNGTVFADRLRKRTRKRLDRQAAAVAHQYPEDWPVTPATREPAVG